MDEEEYKKLPVEDRCVHKLWKARVSGYEDVTRLFRQIDDEKSPEFGKYLGLVKKFVVDSNAMGQEKGLEATLAFVENYAHAGKTVGEVMSGIITKCMAAPKSKTRDLALQVTLMYVEIEKQDVVQEELLKGMDLKNPKIVAACVTACTTALKEFGSKVFPVKPLAKKISTLFADRDKTVRDEARLLVIEMYKWVGPAIKPQLTNLQPVQVTELEAEFAKIEGQKPVPSRYLRSQQEKAAAQMVEEAVIGDCNDEDNEEEVNTNMDPYDLADPQEILSKLPKDFYEKLEAKKWQERKEALEALERLVQTPKLETGDYGDLVRALKKIIQKDSNVVVVALAAKCLTGLANGLKKRFQTYSGVCIPALLEKFKEKKQNVVVAIRDAVDAVFLSTSIEAILEDVIEALNNKNPSVKSETALFLSRSFAKTLPVTLNKKLLKALTGGLITLVNQPDPTVRDSACEALGTLLKLVGEKAVGPFLVELEKDNLKMTKIRECCEKAVILVKVPVAKKDRQPTNKAPAKPQSTAVKRPNTASSASSNASTKKKPEISSGTATIVKSKGNKTTKAAPAKKPPVERELSDEEVDGIVNDILPSEIIVGLTDSNWKTRLSAAEQMLTKLQGMDANIVPTQAMVKLIAKKPGLKDINFQVLKVRLDVVKYLAGNCSFSITTAYACLNDTIEKLADAKNGAAAGEVLTAISEATSLGYVSAQVMEFAVTQKSPKVLQEALNWLSSAIKEFGFGNLNAKVLIETGRKGLGSSNPAVRASAITFMGVLYLYMGSVIYTFFENEKAALRDQLHVEFEKYANEKPPSPIRGITRSESSVSVNKEVEDEDSNSGTTNVADLLPRVDISPLITETLINELSDKNWKIRNEALTKINSIIKEAKLIKPNIGDLPQALEPRLLDTNSKIAQATINLCETIALSMGPACKNLIRVLFPGLLHGLGDSKSYVREAALTTINAFGDQCGYKEFFESEMIADALKTGSPLLKSELWAWIAEKLPNIPVKQIPKPELICCIPHLYANLEDRNADVRKNAQEAVLGVMIHLGYESMVKQCEKIKPASKTVVMGVLEKVKPNLPARAEPAKKIVPPKEDKEVKVKGGAATNKTGAKPKSGAMNKQPSVSSRKKDDDVDTSPLLVVNNMKHQRTLDESKLKVLKWNFTTPREEFFELLKDQMTQANVNRTLITNMFHADFRFHIKAIEALQEDLKENSAALISNLDLVLKWLTLRFFDTNPSVLLKSLEYLNNVFKMLFEHKYRMLENEALSFIPYLVLKTGDPKDSVRSGVRLLLDQICYVYPVSNLFSCVMDGMKSKNARQRAECLEIMGSIINGFGITVCFPSTAACLKEVAKQISDRDNAVRSAALNCLVEAHCLIGEKVYKMVGQISEKDMSLLEERIKRAAKKPNRERPKSKLEPLQLGKVGPSKELNQSDKDSSTEIVAENGDSEKMVDDEDVDDVEDDLPQVTLPSQVPLREGLPPQIDGPFKLDPELMRMLDSFKPTPVIPVLQQIDCEFLKEEIVIPPTLEEYKKQRAAAPNAIPAVLRNHPLFKDYKAPVQQNIPRDSKIEKIINDIDHHDIVVAVRAIQDIQDILNNDRGNTLLPYEDQLMEAIAKHLGILSCINPDVDIIPEAYKVVLSFIDSFYNHKPLGKNISAAVLRDVLHQFILLLAEPRFSKIPTADNYIRVVNVNCVKVIEMSNKTNVLCALVSLLQQGVATEQHRMVELIMKCLWRVLKIMSAWVDEIDYDKVLLEVHAFMKQFPNSWWKSRESDTPMRTIKTLLHTMTKMKGDVLLLSVYGIPNRNDSELEAYVVRYLKSLKIEDSMKVPLKSEGRQPLSRSTHTLLTDIFQKIGNKAETKQGLNMLYDFLQQHPEANIEPFLKKSSSFFQEYIQKNLKEIEIERKAIQDGQNRGNQNDAGSPESENTNEVVQYWKHRLEMWKDLWQQISKS
nr:protein mini spindles [Onthophagus taurus]